MKNLKVKIYLGLSTISILALPLMGSLPAAEGGPLLEAPVNIEQLIVNIG